MHAQRGQLSRGVCRRRWPGGKVEAARPTRDPDPPAKRKPAEQKAWYQKLGDWAGEQAHNAGQAVVHPVEGLKGAAKGIGNIPGDLWNLLAMGATAQAGGEMMNSAAMQSAFGGGSAADAEATFKLSSQMATTPGTYAPTVRQAFTMSNAAQEGGDLIATVIPTPKGLAEGVGKLGAKLAGKALKCPDRLDKPLVLLGLGEASFELGRQGMARAPSPAAAAFAGEHLEHPTERPARPGHGRQPDRNHHAEAEPERGDRAVRFPELLMLVDLPADADDFRSL